MKFCTSNLRPLLLVLLGFIGSVPLHAQGSKIFVSNAGSDTSAGGRGTPKRTFQAAHDAVSAGGEIVALDTAGYGTLVITKAISITVPPGVNGFVTTTPGNTGITINAAATDAISLRGLVIEAAGGQEGIIVSNAGTINLDDCTISGFTDNGLGVQPASNIVISLNRCTIRGSSTGVACYSGTTTTTKITVADSYISASDTAFFLNGANTNGVLRNTTVAGSPTGAFATVGAHLTLQNCTLSQNGIGVESGVFEGSTGAVVRIDGSAIVNNVTHGLFTSGGTILSRSNNTFLDNGPNSSFSTYAAQ